MNLKRAFSRGVSRLLAGRRGGYWIAARPTADAIYLFLFGATGETLAAWLPPRTYLDQTGGRSAGRPLRLIVFTDRHASAQAVHEAGHMALTLPTLSEIPPHRRARWLMAAVKSQMAFFSPRAVFFSPDFPAAFDQARRFLVEMAEYVPDGAPFSRPAVLAPEMTLDFTGIWAIVDKMNDSAPPPGWSISIFHFGRRDFFDYGEHLEGAGNVEPPRCLGWKIPQQRALASAQPVIGIWVRDPSARHELARNLAPVATAAGARLILFEPERGCRHLLPDPTQSVQSLTAFLELVSAPGGFTVADGDCETLLLAGTAGALVLVKSLSRTPDALLKSSWYLGAGRVPVFENQRELLSALSGWAPGSPFPPPPDLTGGDDSGADAWHGFATQIYGVL